MLGRFGRQLSGRILIVGGYGAFGAHVAQRLARQTKLEIIIAGRSAERAAAFASRLARTADATISHAVVDATNVGAAEIKALGARVTVNASGPFQGKRPATVVTQLFSAYRQGSNSSIRLIL
ncbi:MAG: KR domain-containing protein [Hyphomicrobium sp.]|nr:KR domain-containing protein [Hyphomicrobium sp.]